MWPIGFSSVVSCDTLYLLSHSLAAQREQYLKDKADATETYKKALEAQVLYPTVWDVR